MAKKNWKLMLFGALALAVLAGSQLLAQRSNETLHQRVQKAGGKLVWTYTPNRGVIYPNLEELAKRSEVIIVGRAIGHRGRLTPDGNSVVNEFSVRVQEVIKGDMPNGRSIQVRLPGGSYRFPDRTHVFVKPLGYTQAVDGGIYVFFLNKQSPVDKAYEPTSETQSLFALTGGRVRPANQVAYDPLVLKYGAMDAASFLSQLHRAVPREKKPK
jgi:hypothetical protein